jgi:DNA-3-methyladenine glycosylase
MSTLDPNYDWLEQDSLIVAPNLLGWELVSHTGGAETAGRIVEVEAYHGTTDPASHAWRGLTTRTEPMFERGGAVYVYLSYGVHACINIVTGRAGEASAVLIRALEPTVGLELMARRRGTSDPLGLASGPGKLTQALGITLDLSGSRLGQSLSLLPPESPVTPAQIATGPRIGIRRAADRPWRFYLRDNSFVSRR